MERELTWAAAEEERTFVFPDGNPVSPEKGLLIEAV